MSFQENLIRARKARGMTQEELAARLSISRQAVSKWRQEFPIVKDTTPNITNSRLNNIP